MAEDEVFELAKNLGLVDRPNNTTYIMGENKFVGKKAFVTYLKENPESRKLLIQAAYARDRA